MATDLAERHDAAGPEGDAFDRLFADRKRDVVVRIERDVPDDGWPSVASGSAPGPRGGKPWSPVKASRRRMQKRSRKANRGKRTR